MDEAVSPWAAEWPDTPRLITGQKHRVARLRGLGNAVVPQIPFWIATRIRRLLEQPK